MQKIPELSEMLKRGVHFGHQSSKRNPKMKPYIYTSRNGINIIDLERTAEKLADALIFAENIAATGGTVLFVSSKNQAKALIEKYAKDCGMPYINNRWLGGMFTNFSSIIKLVKRLKELEEKQQSGELEKYTKKEQLDFQRTITKLNDLVGGIRDLQKLPEAMYVVDIKKEKTAVSEAIAKKVPILAMTDTNVNPEKVDYPIPANDDAIKSIELITGLVAEAIKAGKAKPKTAVTK